MNVMIHFQSGFYKVYTFENCNNYTTLINLKYNILYCMRFSCINHSRFGISMYGSA